MSKWRSGAEGSQSHDSVIASCAIIEVVKWDTQERVEECCATTAADAVASEVIESVDYFEVRPPRVEFPECVFRERTQQRAFDRLADISEAVEKLVVPDSVS